MAKPKKDPAPDARAAIERDGWTLSSKLAKLRTQKKQPEAKEERAIDYLLRLVDRDGWSFTIEYDQGERFPYRARIVKLRKVHSATGVSAERAIENLRRRILRIAAERRAVKEPVAPEGPR
jgi:hypothetical protein